MERQETIRYRRAQDADLDAMFELWWEMQAAHVAYDPIWYGLRPKPECKPLCLERFRKQMSSPDDIILLAVAGESPVGMIIGHITERPPVLHQLKFLVIENAVVTEAHRKKGILRQLMALIAKEATSRGVKLIKLIVHSANPARQAYERLGFTCHELSMGKYIE